jgi:hypothetical protein
MGDGQVTGKSVVQPKLVSRLPDSKKGGTTMKSKLLQKKSYDVNQSREVVDGQQENIEGSSLPWRGRETPPAPVNPAVGAEARKGFPSLLKRNYQPARG